MSPIVPCQAVRLIHSMDFHLRLVPHGGPAFGAMLPVAWERAGATVGLRGNPRNPWNSLVLESRLLQVTSFTGETGLGFLLKGHRANDSYELYLTHRNPSPHAFLQITMPPDFLAYPHCVDFLTDDGPTSLDVHALEGHETRSWKFIRLKDLWRSNEAKIDPRRVEDLVTCPAELASWGALHVSRAFDATDVRWASSPWARFLIEADGLEGAVAAKALGMNWSLAKEDPKAMPGSIFSHQPL